MAVVSRRHKHSAAMASRQSPVTSPRSRTKAPNRGMGTTLASSVGLCSTGGRFGAETVAWTAVPTKSELEWRWRRCGDVVRAVLRVFARHGWRRGSHRAAAARIRIFKAPEGCSVRARAHPMDPWTAAPFILLRSWRSLWFVTWIPARRAARIDPMTELQEE